MPTKSERTRLKILECAKTLFYEKGLLDTPQQEIADLAGVNRGLIHHYFGNKESIAAEIFEEFDNTFYQILHERFFCNEPDAVYVSIAQGRILFNYLLTHPKMKRFFAQLTQSSISNDCIEISIYRDFDSECRYLGLKYTEEQKQMYSLVLASVESRLMGMRMSEEFSFPVEEVITIYNQIHLKILGLSDAEIAARIARAIETSRKISFEGTKAFEVKPENFLYEGERIVVGSKDIDLDKKHMFR